MNYLNEAIKLAIEKGGYNAELCKPSENKLGKWHSFNCPETINGQKDLVLDPLFWQALGKALEERFEKSQAPSFVSFDKWDWTYYAHQYFDLIMTEQSTDEFWKSLLIKGE